MCFIKQWRDEIVEMFFLLKGKKRLYYSYIMIVRKVKVGVDSHKAYS